VKTTWIYSTGSKSTARAAIQFRAAGPWHLGLAATCPPSASVRQELVEGDPEADAAALHVCFLSVYPSGFSGRDEHAQALAGGPTVKSYELSDLRVMRLGDGHALLAYRADYTRFAGGKAEVMYVSSIWRRAGEGWVNVFSQDTPASDQEVP
jgi:hypothetical protein